MTKIEEFAPLVWLSKFSPTNEPLNSETLEPILSFTLIWNLFETVACNRNGSIRSIDESINNANDHGLLKSEDFSDFLIFFQSRYVQDRDIDQLPEYLLSRRGCSNIESDKIRLLQDVLQGNSTAIGEIVSSLLFIAYRIRNNLFHGEKNLFTLDTQLDLFRAVNFLLAQYLDIAYPGIRG